MFAQQISFNRDWQFCRLDEHGGKGYNSVDPDKDWMKGYLSSVKRLELSEDALREERQLLRTKVWETVDLPHTPYIEALVIQHQWQGICYYKKDFSVSPQCEGKKIYIEFEGAMQLSDIWVNGVHLAQHAGGYDPFVIDLSDKVFFNKTNEIIVRLDNRNNPLIPPGRPIEVMDFCYYGGIYRDVNLLIKNPVHITHAVYANKIAGGGIFVTYPSVAPEKAQVEIKTNVINESFDAVDFTIEHSIFELKSGVKDGEKFFQEGSKLKGQSVRCSLSEWQSNDYTTVISVTNPRLWSPDSPNLYLLKTRIVSKGKVVDEETTHIGIRRIEFSKEKGFLINGHLLRLVGTNRHMDYPYVGNAISDRAQYRDIYKIKEGGFNLVRLSHYLQDRSVLDACDELGLLVIEPIPGWQFFNQDSLFCDLTYRDTKSLIRRDRNHPSIVMWETMLNESGPTTLWKSHVVAVAHQEYPGDQCYTSGDSYGYDGFDVCYNDWKEGFIRSNNTSKPGFIREHYDYEFGGERSTTRKSRGNGENALLQNAWNAQWSHNHYRSQYPWTCGDAVWSMYDYNRGCYNFICKSGVSDIFRLPKFSWWFFRLQQPVGTPLSQSFMSPELFIANYWTPRKESDKVIVYGNVEEVELRVNGHVVGRQKADNGADLPYAPTEDQYYTGGVPFDKGNCRNLTNPPFTFTNIPWKEGNVEAIGFINGKVVVEQNIYTPGNPSMLNIKVDESGKKWVKGDDIVFVYVSVLDKRGTLCIEDSSKIKFSATGDAQIIGNDEINAEAGIATFLVRSGNKGGKIKLLAKCKNSSSQIQYVLK